MENREDTALSNGGAERSFGRRWGHDSLFERGYVPTPTSFLRLYAKLKPFPLSVGEAMFILHLMGYKWDSKAPYPSYKTIAEQMGVSDKLVRKHAQSLEVKKFLKRVERAGRTNQFDMTGLFDALADAVEKEKLERKQKRRNN